VRESQGKLGSARAELREVVIRGVEHLEGDGRNAAKATVRSEKQMLNTLTDALWRSGTLVNWAGVKLSAHGETDARL
jgi:hypothetical protein